MKKTIYPKLLSACLLFGLLGFLTVSIITSRLSYDYILSAEASNLHKEAKLLADDYAKNHNNSSMTLEAFESRLSALDAYLGAQIWMVGSNGELLASSREKTDPAHIKNMQGFIDYFKHSYYQTGSFYGCFEDEQLSVLAAVPASINYKRTLDIYIILHKPLEQIASYNNGILEIAYLTLAILFFCVCALLGLLAYTIILPVRKITKAAGEYAQGKFEHTIDIRADNELGRLAASLSYMANELNTLEEDQRKFISNVSHDFRSPLTSVKGYIEAMLDGTIPVENQEKYLNIILFETERLNKLTASLLELNRYGSHRALLHIATFDINHTIKLTVQTFEGICKDKRISFELILTGQTLFVRADMGKIQRAIHNLIDNAIKFSPSDSVITIETTVKNEKIFVAIKDRGFGIPKESLGKIWERFYKSDPSRGRDKSGTGLGLAIVKEIIQSHKEHINVISTEGVGTEFIFSLPLHLPDDE